MAGSDLVSVAVVLSSASACAGFVRQHRAGQPRARAGLHQCDDLARAAIFAAEAVHGVRIEGEAVGAAVGRCHHDAAEGIHPFAGKACAAEAASDGLHRRDPLAQGLDKGLLDLIIVEFVYGFRGAQHDLVEPGLVALQQRTNVGGRFRKGALQRLFDFGGQRVVIGLLAGVRRGERAIGAAEAESGGPAAQRAQICIEGVKAVGISTDAAIASAARRWEADIGFRPSNGGDAFSAL